MLNEPSDFRGARSGACWSGAANSSALTSRPRPATTSLTWRRNRCRPVGRRELYRRRRRRRSSSPSPCCCGCAGHTDDTRTPTWSPATRALVAVIQGHFFIICFAVAFLIFCKSCFSGVSSVHLLYFLTGRGRSAQGFSGALRVCAISGRLVLVHWTSMFSTAQGLLVKKISRESEAQGRRFVFLENYTGFAHLLQ